MLKRYLLGFIQTAELSVCFRTKTSELSNDPKKSLQKLLLRTSGSTKIGQTEIRCKSETMEFKKLVLFFGTLKGPERLGSFFFSHANYRHENWSAQGVVFSGEFLRVHH